MARVPRSAESKGADGNWCTTRILQNWIVPEIVTGNRSTRITQWDWWPGSMA